MSLYRKKPVVIEARQVTVDEHADIAAWCGGTATYAYIDSVQVPDGVLIKTLEGVMNAQHGDWIIKGVQGEFYPCKPDIFDATYEPADGAP